MTRPLLAVVPLSRPGRELAHAASLRRAAFALLERLPIDLTGPRALYLDTAGQRRAARALAEARPDHLLFLQLTFTPPAPTVRIAQAVGAPVLLWGFPDPEGEVSQSSIEGAEAAAGALDRAGITCTCLRARPEDPAASSFIASLLDGGRL